MKYFLNGRRDIALYGDTNSAFHKGIMRSQSKSCKHRFCFCVFIMIQTSRNIADATIAVLFWHHYGDVIKGAIASQITSLIIVYSIVYSGADQRKHQSSVSLAFVWGIHRGPVNSPYKWPVTRKMFLFDDVIMMCKIGTWLANRFLIIFQFHEPFVDWAMGQPVYRQGYPVLWAVFSWLIFGKRLVKSFIWQIAEVWTRPPNSVIWACL